jgi:hypothetical protein
MSVFDGHHNIPALIPSSGVLPSGCPMLYYMLDAQLFPQPQPAPDGERSIHFQTLLFFRQRRVSYKGHTTRLRLPHINGST